jgi:hypothetical protein
MGPSGEGMVGGEGLLIVLLSVITEGEAILDDMDAFGTERALRVDPLGLTDRLDYSIPLRSG